MILRPRELNTASVPLGQARSGQAGGGGRGAHWPWRQGQGRAAALTWRVLRAGAAAAAAAGRGHGPGLPARRSRLVRPAALGAPRRRRGPGPTPATRSPRRTGPRYVGRFCTHAVPCLSLFPEHPSYPAPGANLRWIDCACPAKDIELLRSCFTNAVSWRL